MLEEIKSFFKFFGKISKLRNASIFATGHQYSLCLFCRFFGFILGKYHIYIYNFYIHGLIQKRSVKHILRFLLNSRHVTMISQSLSEQDFYHRLAPKAGSEFVPYCSDIKLEGKTGDYIFTGGYTNRDFNLVIDVARELPHLKFRIIVSSRNGEFKDVPQNCFIERDTPSDYFNSVVAGARIIVVPLKEDVGSSGQMLVISGMRSHKPIVYSNIPAINYYFTPDSGIPYEIRDKNSLKSALLKLTADEDLCASLSHSAFERSKQYSIESYCRMIDKIIFKE